MRLLLALQQTLLRLQQPLVTLLRAAAFRPLSLQLLYAVLQSLNTTGALLLLLLHALLRFLDPIRILEPL